MLRRGGLLMFLIAFGLGGAPAKGTDDSSMATAGVCALEEGLNCFRPRLIVVGTDASERVEIGPDAESGDYLVSDSAGIVPTPAEPHCRSQASTLVACADVVEIVSVALNGGDDQFSNRIVDDLSFIGGGAGADELSAAPGGRRVGLSGDKGADVLLGGARGDYLDGGRGNDELRGARGADQLWAGAGWDVLRGGRGDDRLNATSGRGSERDRLIDCGRGRDRVVIDSRDPKPRRCERIVELDR